MNDKDSTTLREQYGRKLAAHLCDQHFGSRPTATLDGPAVLRFTPIKQVNLFVVQQLLAQWTQEMARLRSPYFDFEADDVRAALTQFMNVLSRRIKLSRGTFEPLLVRAITDTLVAAQDPASTLDEKLLNRQPMATSTQLRDALRYLDLNKPLYQGFLDTLPADTALERESMLQQFRQHIAANTALQQPFSAVITEFNALLPLRAEDLQPAAPATPTPSTPAPVAPVAPPAPVVAAPEPPRPATPPTPEPTQPAVPTPAPAVAAQPAVVLETPTAVVEEVSSVVPLYQKLKASQPATQTLSETLRPESTLR